MIKWQYWAEPIDGFDIKKGNIEDVLKLIELSKSLVAERAVIEVRPNYSEAEIAELSRTNPEALSDDQDFRSTRAWAIMTALERELRPLLAFPNSKGGLTRKGTGSGGIVDPTIQEIRRILAAATSVLKECCGDPAKTAAKNLGPLMKIVGYEIGHNKLSRYKRQFTKEEDMIFLFRSEALRVAANRPVVSWESDGKQFRVPLDKVHQDADEPDHAALSRHNKVEREATRAEKRHRIIENTAEMLARYC